MKRIYTLVTLAILVSASSISWGQTAIDLAGPGNSAVINYELPNSPFTVQYDMYMHSLQDYNAGVTVTCGSNPAPFDFYVNNAGASTSFVGNCGAYHGFNPATTFAAGTWYNIAVVFPGGTQGIQIYVDGILTGTHLGFGIGGTSYSFYVDDFIRIGTRGDDATNADAKYDNLRVWSIARSPSQILSDMGTCLTGNEPGLDILMDMEEGTGTTIFDKALGNGAQNATVNGSYSWTSGKSPSPVSFTASVSPNFICPGDTVQLNTTAGFNVDWSNPTSIIDDTTAASTFGIPSASGNYFLEVQDLLTNCIGKDTLQVIVNALPTVSAGNDVTHCEGESSSITVSGAATYVWSPANGLSATSGTTVTANPTSSSQYIVIGTDANGCENADTINVNVNVLPIVSAGNDVTFCEGGSSSITASGAATYSWSPATGLSATSGATVTADPTSSSQYVVIGTDANGCENADTINVNVNPNPNIDLGADVFQVNPPAILDAGSGFSSYTWSSGGSSQTNSVSMNGTYNVEVVDGNGCSASDTIMVTFTAGVYDLNGTAMQVKVYPNPASSFITLEMNDYNGAPISVALVDANGKQLREIAFNNLMKIDISNYQAGVYFLRINTGQEVKLVQFIVE